MSDLSTKPLEGVTVHFSFIAKVKILVRMCACGMIIELLGKGGWMNSQHHTAAVAL